MSNLPKAKSPVPTAECHAFVPSSSKTRLNAKTPHLLKVIVQNTTNAQQPRVLEVEGFKYNGKRVIRYVNAGKFSIPSEYQIKSGGADFSESSFAKQAASTIINLTFK